MNRTMRWLVVAALVAVGFVARQEATSAGSACVWDDPKQMNFCIDVFCEINQGICIPVESECLCQLAE